MASGKNKKKGQKKVGKEAPSTSLATDASPPMFLDNDCVLGYFDLAYRSLQKKDINRAVNIMQRSCLMHFSHPLIRYWLAWFSLEKSYAVRSGIDYKREDVWKLLCIARKFSHQATILSPYDIEFHRFYVEILAASAIFEECGFSEAIKASNKILNLPEETMVFQEKLCSTHNKEAIITAIRVLKEKICSNMEENISESPSSKPVPFYQRVDKPKEKQIAVKLFMPEMEQKTWRRSCWESMSDDKKVEFLALKYEDLRTFFIDKHLDRAKEVLMQVFSVSLYGDSLKLLFCYRCTLFFNDYKSHMLHVRSKHISELTEHLKKLLPEEDKCEIRLPDTDDSKLSITVNKAKLTLHISNGTTGKISFEPENLKSLLPDPETFVDWLNLDEYVEKQMDDSIAAEGAKFELLNKNFNELKFLCLEKHETITMVKKAIGLIGWHCLEELKKMNCQKSTVLKLLKAVHENLNEKFKECPENVISIKHQFDVISDMIMSELDSTKDTEVLLSSDQLEVHMDLVFKSRKELLAKECEIIDSKLREKITLKNHLESDLSCLCRFDYSEHLLPHLGLYIKAQLAKPVLTYATEQADKLAEQLTMEEAKKNATGGSSLSEQSVRNPKKKTKKKNKVSRAYDNNAEIQDCNSSIPQKEEQPQSESSVEHEHKLHKVLECQRHPSDEMNQNIQHLEEETNTPISTLRQSESSVGPESKLHEVLECQMHLLDEMKQNILQLEEETNTHINTVCQSKSSVEPESKLHEVLQCQRHPSDEMKQNIQHSEEDTNIPFNAVCQSESSVGPESKLHEVCQMHPSDEMKQNIQQLEEETNTSINTLCQSESSVGPESKLHEVLQCQRHPSDEMKQNIQYSEEDTNIPFNAVCQSKSSVGSESKLHDVLECQMNPSDEMKQNIQQLEEETNTPIKTVCQFESSVGPESKLHEVLQCQRHPSDEMKQNIQHSEEDTNIPFNVVCQSESSVGPESKLPEVLECQRHLSDWMKQNIQHSKEETSTPLNTVCPEQPAVDMSLPIHDIDIVSKDNYMYPGSDNEDVFLTMFYASIKERCLWNVIFLALCKLKPLQYELATKLSLHKDIGSPCFVCQIGAIVDAFRKESAEERTVNSILGKLFSIINTVDDSNHQNKAHYDAPDVLLAIFHCLHVSLTTFSDSDDQVDHTSINLCLSGSCLMHKLFGMNTDSVIEYPCGLVARHQITRCFHFLAANDLRSIKMTYKTSFQETSKEMSEEWILNHRYVCQRSCHCQKYSNIGYKILSCPAIYVAVLHEHIDNIAHDISARLKTILEEIDLSAMHAGLETGSKYSLQSMICHLPKYFCFTRELENEKWLFYDGLRMEYLSCWDAVLAKCEDETFCPQILMYVKEGFI